MKKSLIALAVMAALPTFAQAQSSIQLTGSIDVAVESLNKDATGQDKGDLQINDGIWGGSRVGIVGTEDLGNGLKALFNLEYRAKADNGELENKDVFWEGQSWVGLGGGFGTVRLGRHDTPLQLALDGTGDLTAGSWYYNGDELANMTTIRSNSVMYETPSLGGFSLYAQYSAGESTEPAANANLNKLNDFYGIGARGEFGPISVGLGYQVNDGAKIANIKNTNELGAALGANFGRFGAGITYVQTQIKYENGAASNKTKGAAASMSLQVTDNGTAYVSYRREDPQGRDNNIDGVGLTYTHGLSKRTYVYGAVGIGKEQQGAAADDNKPRRFALGVRHFF